MNLVELMEIWTLQNDGREPMELLMAANVDERIDKKLLMEQIVIQCGGLTPMFNTSWSFDTWHKHWFDYHKGEISKLIDTLDLEYNPIESYSRYEDMKHNAKEDTNTTDNDVIEETRKRESTDSDENTVSAYNESLYQPDSKRDGKSNEAEGRKLDDKREYKRGREFNSKDDNYVHGNNGLFTVQHLIEEQRRLVTFNVMDWIVNKYMKDGFLLVY